MMPRSCCPQPPPILPGSGGCANTPAANSGTTKKASLFISTPVLVFLKSFDADGARYAIFADDQIGSDVVREASGIEAHSDQRRRIELGAHNADKLSLRERRRVRNVDEFVIKRNVVDRNVIDGRSSGEGLPRGR